MKYTNEYGYSTVGDVSEVSMFTFNIRKPYTDSTSTLVTETISMNNLKIDEAYFGDGGRFFSINY